MKTLTEKLHSLSRERLEEIAKQCVLEAIPISQLLSIANRGLEKNLFTSEQIRTREDRCVLVDFVMDEKVKDMGFRTLCRWVRVLGDIEELQEVLSEDLERE